MSAGARINMGAQRGLDGNYWNAAPSKERRKTEDVCAACSIVVRDQGGKDEGKRHVVHFESAPNDAVRLETMAGVLGNVSEEREKSVKQGQERHKGGQEWVGNEEWSETHNSLFMAKKANTRHVKGKCLKHLSP